MGEDDAFCLGHIESERCVGPPRRNAHQVTHYTQQPQLGGLGAKKWVLLEGRWRQRSLEEAAQRDTGGAGRDPLTCEGVAGDKKPAEKAPRGIQGRGGKADGHVSEEPSESWGDF